MATYVELTHYAERLDADPTSAADPTRTAKPELRPRTSIDPCDAFERDEGSRSLEARADL